jgi:L-amino acid N-acyltransferase
MTENNSVPNSLLKKRFISNSLCLAIDVMLGENSNILTSISNYMFKRSVFVKMKLNIRMATREDVPFLLHIYNDAILHTTATFEIDERTVEEQLEWFDQFNENYPLFVVEVDGVIAGYSSIAPFNKKAAYKRTVENSLYIHPNYKGRGIGKKLLQKTIEYAREVGYHTIIAIITDDNTGSIILHEKFGFVFSGTLKEVGNKFGEWRGISYYQLML